MSAERTIAIVEDEPDQRRNCADALRCARGYRTRAFGSRAAALAGLEGSLPDLAILDIVLGDDRDGGFLLCRELLRRRPELPVIFLSALSDEVSQVSGLTLGAWDFQTKPVSLRVLAEKVATLFRLQDLRDAPGAGREIRAGALRIDESRVEAFWGDARLELTLTELRILSALARQPGAVVTYEALMRSSLQAIVTRNTVNTHVMRLRRKLRAIDPGFGAIRSEYGLGYRWMDA